MPFIALRSKSYRVIFISKYKTEAEFATKVDCPNKDSATPRTTSTQKQRLTNPGTPAPLVRLAREWWPDQFKCRFARPLTLHRVGTRITHGRRVEHEEYISPVESELGTDEKPETDALHTLQVPQSLALCLWRQLMG